MKTNNTTLPTGPGATSSGPNIPANGKYHDQTPLIRSLLAGSAGAKLWASIQRVPNFYPAQWPIGSIFWYLALIAAGIYSSTILALLTSLSGNVLLAVGTPVLISLLEFVVTPAMKYSCLRDKQVALMKAFTAGDRASRESAAHAAKAWSMKDYIVFLILILCLASKVVVLINFGAYQAPALLAWNYTIAVLDFTFHLSGLTTRVPCFVAARMLNQLHLRRRQSAGYQQMGTDGKQVLGGLPFREFPFTTVVPIRCGEIDGHTILHRASDDTGHHYTLYSPGTLDDADRDAYLNCKPNH